MKRKVLFNLLYNHFLQLIIPIFVVTLAIGFSPINVSAETPPEVMAKQIQAANADLEMLAQEVAKLSSTPGFRGFLRSELAKSKNRENIIELDRFLDRASKQKNMPPGLAKAKYDAVRAKKTSLQPFSFEGRLDLYFPVEAHNKKWRGGDDFLVAAQPADDESNIKQIIAYQVRDGKKVTLDPKTPPAIPVLVVAYCEHKSHEAFQIQPEPVDSSLPKPDFVGKEAPDKPVKQEKGNSFVGIWRFYFRNDKEHWTRGDPEMNIQSYQAVGTQCTNSKNTDYRSIIRKANKERRWYTLWYPPNTSNCVSKSTLEKYNGGVSWEACHYFSGYEYGRSLYVYIYEQDGGSSIKTTFNLDGRPCINARFSQDDFVDSGKVYQTNFYYNDYYKHDMGNAYVLWYKVP